MNYEYFRRLSAGILAILLAACAPYIPATTPPQLQHTPGAFIVVDEHIYDAGVFRVAYPPGWRIVKSSIASAAMEVVFVSPDNAMTIHMDLSDCRMPEGTTEPGWKERYQLVGDVCLLGRAIIEREAEFKQIFEKVAASVQ